LSKTQETKAPWGAKKKGPNVPGEKGFVVGLVIKSIVSSIEGKKKGAPPYWGKRKKRFWKNTKKAPSPVVLILRKTREKKTTPSDRKERKGEATCP